MTRKLLSISACLSLLAGCATTSQTQWTPTVDTFGNSRAQYLSRDMEECRALATRTSGTTGQQATRGAVQGGLLGAAGGAAIGGAAGGSWSGAGTGAAIGAVAGSLVGGISRSREAEKKFQQAFRNCLRNRGHNVIN